MIHGLAEERFGSNEDERKWFDEWFAAKGKGFYGCGIHKLPERSEKCITSDGAYFEQSTFYHSSEFNLFFRKKIRVSYLYNCNI